MTNSRTPDIDTNTKRKNDIKHDQQQDVENIINNDIENIGIDDQASIIVGKYLHDNNIDYSESDTMIL